MKITIGIQRTVCTLIGMVVGSLIGWFLIILPVIESLRSPTPCVSYYDGTGIPEFAIPTTILIGIVIIGMILYIVYVYIRAIVCKTTIENVVDATNEVYMSHMDVLTAFAAHARDLQPATVAMLEREGYKFTNILDDGWQKVAFTLYTELCELNLKARQVLGEDDG